MSTDHEYYRNRLENPDLIDQAVMLPKGQLAVPIGGKRRGGHAMFYGTYVEARKAAKKLRKMPGFPNAMARHPHYSGPVLIEWGPGDADWNTSPCLSFKERITGQWSALGRYYGYSESAIAKFCDVSDSELAEIEEESGWLLWNFLCLLRHVSPSHAKTAASLLSPQTT